jgi:propanediol dehydratase large subunit
MWFIGLVVGAMIGVMLPGSGMILAGAGIGAAIGAILGSRNNARRDQTSRLEQLSARVAELSSRLTIVESRLGVGSPAVRATPNIMCVPRVMRSRPNQIIAAAAAAAAARRSGTGSSPY